MPLPNTVVGSHCAWELRLNTVPNRIPGKKMNNSLGKTKIKRQKLFSETITEILCYNPGGRCGGSNYYNCKQMKAKMLVGHTDKEWRVRTLRNITINIGCSCVYREPVLLNQFIPGPEERKKRSER